jgi:hypothetical protein
MPTSTTVNVLRASAITLLVLGIALSMVLRDTAFYWVVYFVAWGVAFAISYSHWSSRCRISKLAVISGVLGTLPAMWQDFSFGFSVRWWVICGSVLAGPFAVAVAVIALVRIHRSGGAMCGRAFAVVGLTFGLFWAVLFLGILLIFALPGGKIVG